MPSMDTSAANGLAKYAPGISAPAFPARGVSGLIHWAKANGIAPSSLIEDIDATDPRQLLSYQAVRTGYVRAARAGGGAAVACVMGAHKTLNHIGPLGPAQMSQRTLREAKVFGFSRQIIAGSVMSIELSESDGIAAVEGKRLFDDDECGPIIDIDHLVTVFNLICTFYGARLPLISAEFTCLDTAVQPVLERVFGVPCNCGDP
jgi:hypothetical protein